MGVHDNWYTGAACVGDVMVHHNDQHARLKPRFDLIDFRVGDQKRFNLFFDWGCDGAECYQLGISILANEYGDEFALKYYKDFTESIICSLREEENFRITSDDLDKATFKLAASSS